MSWRELAPEEFLKLKEPLVIDVRSPCEHAEERILGSINFPLLSDPERELVGTIYNQNGELEARRRALSIISPKIPVILDAILETRRHGQTLVIYCWRGGLRSETVSSILSIAGFPCLRLTGGYKAWRKLVLDDLNIDRFPFTAVVLNGLTGTGKTQILCELEKLGEQVLNLEELANHRGSAFGALGKGRQPSQKNFEESIWRKLRTFDPLRPVFVESESRKIGKLSIPDCVLSRIRSGDAVLLESSIESRAERLRHDYADRAPNEAEILEAGLEILDGIANYVGKKNHAKILELVAAGDLHGALELLLVQYYDPLYKKSLESRGEVVLVVQVENPADCAKLISDRCQSNMRIL